MCVGVRSTVGVRYEVDEMYGNVSRALAARWTYHHTGSMPEPDIEMEDIPELSEVSKDEEEDEPYTGEDAIEEGDRLFTAMIPCKAEFIQASSNISQHLAEAFHKNTQLKTFHESVPTYLQDFKDLFAKSLFDCLPDRKVWNHVIELVPDTVRLVGYGFQPFK
jgi:hypothetical protein